MLCPRFPRLTPDHFARWAGRGLALAGLCGGWGLSCARAYTPVYTVKKIIRQSDLQPGGPSSPMAVAGLSNHGLLAGYFNAYTTSHGLIVDTVQAFAWNDATQSLLDIGHDDLGAKDSVATCVNHDGTVAGTCWSGSTFRQQGFVWQDGLVIYLDAPDGGDIDAVTALSDVGQVTGTYFPANGDNKRAFLWDGSATVDLGDLGDPDGSFVWPVSVNNDGQVVGTIYKTDTPIYPPPTTAFQWQAGVMSALDDDGDLHNGAAVGLNGAGQVVGTYVLPPPHSGSPAVPSSFFWADSVFTDLGSLGGGGTVPFSIGETGNVIGTSYTGDNTLHLFGWTAPTGALADFGAARLAATDTHFRLTSVNRWGDAAGLVTDAQGHAQVFVRPAGMAAANLATLVAGSTPLDLTPDDTGGTRVVLNDAGLLACAGRDHTGAPVVVLLTPDADGNGLSDGWEMQYFGHLGVDPNGDDDGDGLTNLQECQQGSDPFDFFNGVVPGLVVTGGGDQRGAPGVVLPQCLAVSCARPGLCNAPLHFAVTGGRARLSTSASGPWVSALDVRATTYSAYAGRGGYYAAPVYVRLSGIENQINTVTITTANGGRVQTSEVASDPNLTPPGGLGPDGNAATTVELHWSPSDLSLATALEASADLGATWTLSRIFEAGTTAGTLSHLAPDRVYQFRAYTVGAGGGGSAPGAPTTAELLSVPVVEGVQAGGKYANNSFAARAHGGESVRYLHGHMEYTRYDDTMLWSGGILSLFKCDVNYLKPPDIGGHAIYYERFGFDPNSWAGQLDSASWTMNGDTSATYFRQFYPGAFEKATSFLDTPYPLAEFVVAAQAAVMALSFGDDLGDGRAEAWLHVKAVADGDHAPSPWFNWDPAPLPFAYGYDHTYDLERLHYRFRDNLDRNGRVAYDVVFTPDDGGAVKHEAHVQATNGAVEVPRRADAPLAVEPTQLHGQANGKYRVIPVQLQPDDWSVDDAGNYSFLGEQTGVTGAMVASNHPGATGALHFVSPKAAGGVVRLRAGLPKDVKFEDYYQWAVTGADGKAVAFAADGAKVSLGRDTAGQYVVKVLSKPAPPLASVEITRMIVWIVWGEVKAAESIHPTPYYGIDATPKTVSSSMVKWKYKATILPPAICSKSDDIPDLTGKNPTPVPAIGQIHAIAGWRMPDANSKWNLTRQWREKVITPLNGNGMGYWAFSPFYPEVPTLVSKIMPTSDNMGPDGYPLDDVEGNDWGHSAASDPYNDPYVDIVEDEDAPATGLRYNVGNVSDVVEIHMQFREVLRLNIGDKWYRISDLDGDHNRTRFYLKFKKVNETTQGQDVDGDGQISGDVWQIMQLDAELNNLYF